MLESRDFSIPKGQQLQLYNFNLKKAVSFLFTLNSQNGNEDVPAFSESFQWGEVYIQNSEFKGSKVFILKDS